MSPVKRCWVASVIVKLRNVMSVRENCCFRSRVLNWGVHCCSVLFLFFFFFFSLFIFFISCLFVYVQPSVAGVYDEIGKKKV